MAQPRPQPRTRGTRLHPGIAPGARLHIVTGKGGVGKTTVAAALALARAGTAGRGGRVLLVEVEGRQAIAQLFGVTALPYEERRLVTTPGGGSLWGLAVDAEEAMIDYLDLFYGLKRSARGLKRIGAVDFVTTLAPGLRDVLLTGKVKEAVSRTTGDGHRVYDAVVLDAPPTGRIAKFLDATRQVVNLAKLGPIRRHSEGVVELLHSDRTVVHLVTVLEEMPVQETLDAAAELGADGLALGAVIVNRRRPRLVETAVGSTGVGELADGLAEAGLSATRVPALAEQVRTYAEHQRVQAQNARRLADLDITRIDLPDLTPPLDLGELSELAGYLTDRARPGVGDEAAG